MQEEKKEEKKTENEERFSDALLQWFYKEGLLHLDFGDYVTADEGGGG